MAGRRIGPRRPFRVFLREWREYLDLTQETVGNRFDPPVDRGQISKIETKARTGHIGNETVAAYAEALNRPIVDMYGHPPAKEQPERKSLDEIATELDLEYEDAVRAMRILSRKAS